LSEAVLYLVATNQLVVQVPVMSRECGIPARHFNPYHPHWVIEVIGR
jgi:hypothetical protein